MATLYILRVHIQFYSQINPMAQIITRPTMNSWYVSYFLAIPVLTV
jgi:hypothetical protein